MENTSSDLDTSLKMPVSFTEAHYHHLGPVLAVMLVILALILGGLYLWGSTLVQPEVNQAEATRTIPNNEPETPRAIADTKILETVSSSDELSAIEADLMSTNLDSLDTDLSEAERELDTALRAQ